MSFDPYLHFQGNCAEAMAFYAEVFGADDLMMMRYGEAPEAPPGPPLDEAGRQLVMHAALMKDGRALMGSDYPPGMEGMPQASVSISRSVSDLAAGQTLFDRLAEGGAVIMPFAETFWAEGFGMVKDRFGTHWMISGPMKAGMGCPEEEAAAV